MDHEQRIIDLIKATPAVRPPDDFNLRVMAAVMKAQEGVYARAWNSLSQPREFSFDPIKALRAGTSKNEIGLYFMMVAFAHLILAIVLLMGLKNSDAGALIPPLLRPQPWLSLFLAGWLGFWGFLLKKNTKAGIQGANFATLIYIEVVVINGALLLIKFGSQWFLLPFFGMTASCLIIGGCLALALQKAFVPRAVKR